MFTTDQIISANQLVRNFARISRRLEHSSEALLIHQKSGHFLVLVNAEMFEDLVRTNFRTSHTDPTGQHDADASDAA